MTNKCFEIGIVDNQQDFVAAMELRRKVFVEEEKVPSEKEFDKNDLVGSVHFYMKDDEKLVGTLRARLFPEFVKLERLCLQKEYRQSSAAKQLIDYSFEYCAHKGYKLACGLCSEQLLAYWDRLGMKHNKDIPTLSVGPMTLYTVSKQLTPSPDAPSLENPEALISSDVTTAKQHYVNNKISYIMAALLQKQQ